MYTASHISKILNAKYVGHLNHDVKHLLVDSRQLTEPNTTVFIALVTKRNDAHQYIFNLYQIGVRVFLVNHIPKNCAHLSESCYIIVEDTLAALQKLATYHKNKFKIPVIGITGSNGKTVVKEWLYQLLKIDYDICRSPKSYNSQIGVPLSVWQLNHHHNLGIFEAGISEMGEMKLLENIIKPSIGILTSIGTAHDEGFKNSDLKIKEKLLLFKNCKTTIINGLSIDSEILKNIQPKNTFIISTEKNANLQIVEIISDLNSTKISAIYKKQKVFIKIPFTDKASIYNATTCWATLLHLNISNNEIEKRMQNLHSVEMRLELKLANNNCVLINDFYNSDINSLEIAFHYQKLQQRGGKKIVILSDIEQSGKSLKKLYLEVATLLKHFKIDVLIGIGEGISLQKKNFKCESYFYNCTSDFLNDIKIKPQLQFHNSIILLKGARSFGFEKISKQLQQKSHDTILEINLNHLIHNLNFYKSQISQDTLIMCMVKATGYGAGSSEIAFILQHHNVNYLAVAYTDEGVELRKAGIHLPIMVMSPEESSYDDMIDFKLEPEIYSFKVANEFISALQNKAISEPYPIHLKIDTGMHRLGFEENEMQRLTSFLKREKSLYVKSIFSHLVGSDNEAFDDFSKKQISIFEKAAKQIEKAISYKTLKHICNSAAIPRFKNAHYNMVRIGIGLYGVGFNDIEKQNLKNISTLKTRISQIKKVNAGESVGYNRSGIIAKNTSIATLPIGYADGFRRKLGNGNFKVFINNKTCLTVGNICMDMCMIDVTDINCKEGDEVVIFETNLQLKQLSQAMETIPYEVLTGISSRVKRIYIQE
ncbi:MAG: bifunctional UDP-N-acetylmuramoyl-tripeptide:D-alanyl-D-alanine ligase/alanine racemase [Bacteroidota bacterium]